MSAYLVRCQVSGLRVLFGTVSFAVASLKGTIEICRRAFLLDERIPGNRHRSASYIEVYALSSVMYIFLGTYIFFGIYCSGWLRFSQNTAPALKHRIF
ncbi:hypothetical protein NDU88_002507 [Pleurodeles waltl]|uniref:Uncharacterized protein n=1 Tax=Pleurodeles waltl TaxID=8319 RepID=A0AAV7WPP5_PLEWA|nr:hypothetical protein NDU88_002507 [Pleurodeles waltl]